MVRSVLLSIQRSWLLSCSPFLMGWRCKRSWTPPSIWKPRITCLRRRCMFCSATEREYLFVQRNCLLGQVRKEGTFFMSIIVLKPGEGCMLPLSPIRMVVQEDGTQTRGTVGMAIFEVPPHVPTPPPHLHHAHEEGFYVLEGELEFLAGEETVRASAGT